METPFKTMFVEFIRYNNWANQQVLEACKNLTEPQLATAMPGAYGTIRDTLEHIIRAEVGYVKFVTGNCPQPPFEWDAKPSLADMTEFATQIGMALMDVAHRIRPTDRVNEEWEVKRLDYQVLAVFIQIINHGIEHRTNITTILNQRQLRPPEVDGWSYLFAHPDRFDLK